MATTECPPRSRILSHYEYSNGVLQAVTEAVLSKSDFEELLKPILSMAYRYAARLLGGSDEAMDLVQDASVQAFRARHTFQTGTNFKAWFMKILTNLHFAQRQKKRIETTDIEDAPDLILYEHAKRTGADLSGDDPAAWFFSKVDMDQIGDALDHLPSDYREAAMDLDFFGTFAHGVFLSVGKCISKPHPARTGALGSVVSSSISRTGTPPS